jgi:hypothetical protein
MEDPAPEHSTHPRAGASTGIITLGIACCLLTMFVVVAVAVASML